MCKELHVHDLEGFTVVGEIFMLKIFVSKMFVLKYFRTLQYMCTLTHFQLRNAYVENILCVSCCTLTSAKILARKIFRITEHDLEEFTGFVGIYMIWKSLD